MQKKKGQSAWIGIVHGPRKSDFKPQDFNQKSGMGWLAVPPSHRPSVGLVHRPGEYPLGRGGLDQWIMTAEIKCQEFNCFIKGETVYRGKPCTIHWKPNFINFGIFPLGWEFLWLNKLFFSNLLDKRINTWQYQPDEWKWVIYIYISNMFNKSSLVNESSWI